MLQFIPVFFGATFLIFALVFVMPGDPIAALSGDKPLPPDVVQALQERYHLDEPLYKQYGIYITNVMQARADIGGRIILLMTATSNGYYESYIAVSLYSHSGAADTRPYLEVTVE